MKDTTHKQELKYIKSHLVCKKYVTGNDAMIEIVEVKAGDYLIREAVEKNTLVFLLDGQLDVSTGGTVCQRISGQRMFLVCAGDNFHSKAVTDCCLMRCSFDNDMTLCSRFYIDDLKRYVPEEYRESSNGIPSLPLEGLFQEEVELTRNLIGTGLSCIHFQQSRKEVLFMELRAFYSKEDLAILFAPILGAENDFRNSVLKAAPFADTSQQLAESLNMSTTSFNRKFKEAFGIPARQWLIHKKEQKLIRDILMTDMSTMELAEKYHFTSNYVGTFCRQHFGKSAAELRKIKRE